MSTARLQEIALLPLDQRAARIAQLFAEGTAEAPRAPAKRTSLAAMARALAAWAHPRRLPLAAAALAALARALFGSAGHVPARADGFCGVAPIPDAPAALDLFAQGLYFESFPGRALLWSPPRRAIVRPSAALRLPGGGDLGCLEARLDTDFERVLDLCETQRAGRRPACRAPLTELFGRGHAHALELREREETRAGIVGVAVGGVFTVESFFARDRAVFALAVAALARHLAELNFVAIDFRALSPHLYGLPIELISRDNFLALLGEPGGVRPGRWRAKDHAAAQQAAAA